MFAGALTATPALAQWGTIFGGDGPPRPPANVPSRPPAEAQPIPPGGLPPGPPPGRGLIQTQPLPPPPGAASAPPPPAAGPTPGLPPGQRQPRGTPPPGAAALQPGDEVVVEPPPHRITNPTAVFSGLDKITGRIISFDVAIDETVRFGALEVTPRACYSRPPTETPNTDAFVEVDELTLQGELRRIFTGWMFAASPGLNAVEHPIYDIWLADCKGGAQPTLTAETPKETAPPPQPPQRRPAQRSPRATQQLPPPPPSALPR